MKSRTRKQLLFAGETEETLRVALTEHDTTKNEFAASEQASRQWLDRRNHLLAEIDTLQRLNSPRRPSPARRRRDRLARKRELSRLL